ncbi:MAG: PASTA domain-containing protein [Trueperaceae bacterium]|nr:PASTA domain-containing protein [Trueperaceae bacterium]
MLLLLALLGLFAAYTVMSVDDYLDVSEVRVPQVVGMSLDDAYAVFQSLDLSVTTYPENVSDAPVDSVTKQVPAAGAVVRRGRSISLGVHNPPESTQMPSLQGRTAEEAERLLDNLGLYLGEITYAFSDAPEGTVIAQSPALGERVALDSQIDVVVSRGQEVRTVAMPNLVGTSRARAKAQLEEIGFRRIEEVATNISFDNPGNVSAQSPSAGQSVPVSAAVTLYHTVENRSVVRVPDVRGDSLGRARDRLRAAQLTVGWTEYTADPAQGSGVVAVSPSGYTLVGSPVLLRVNTPPAPDVATEPSSSDGDQPRSRIGRILAGDDASSWTEGPTDTQPDTASSTTQPDTAPPNTTQPDVSSALRESTSLGSRSIAIRFNPNLYGFLQGQENDFRLVVIDDRGERVAIDRRLAEDEVLNTSVTVFGDATLQTYINGNFFQAWNP